MRKAFFNIWVDSAFAIARSLIRIMLRAQYSMQMRHTAEIQVIGQGRYDQAKNHIGETARTL